jgi:uncharacterized protein YcaQ
MLSNGQVRSEVTHLETPIVLTPTLARRLAVSAQRLAGPTAPNDSAGILSVARSIGCLQLDPISAVARSHTLVTFSRVGPYDLAHLDTLLWKERSLFEYWAHAASIVLTEDYPIHNALMRNHPRRAATRAWVEANAALRDHILSELSANGPLPSRHFEDKAQAGWHSSGWTSERNVSQMLDYLWTRGEIMVAGRSGLQKLWDLSERVLPDWTPRDILDEHEVTRRAVQKAIRALGVGTARHINLHYIRYRYKNLPQVLNELEGEGVIRRVEIEGVNGKGLWYIHRDDLPLLERLANGDWQPRTTLLSPFDNLICDRARTMQLFHFDFRIEIYVPKDKRKYGYYVLPILHGDRLIGRIDPTMDRKMNVLHVHNVYAEPDAPMTAEMGKAVAGAIEEMATFLGAKTIVYGENAPKGWRQALK